MAQQSPVADLNKWKEQNPIEKIYLHTDREVYFPGQQVWLKGYLLTSFIPSLFTSSMYVELLAHNNIIKREVFPVVNGLSRGQIEIPDTLADGAYILRAYTLQMLNHPPEYLHKKVLQVTGNKTNQQKIPPVYEKISMVFFPEGGSLITGLNNTVAFKIVNTDGLPLALSGKIFNNHQEQVATFTTYHDGMGYFDLPVQKNTSYYAVADNGNGERYSLPSQTENGVVLRVFNTGSGKQFEVVQTGDNPVFKAAYIVGQMQHHTVFTKTLPDTKNEHNGMIQTNNLLSGIMQITVFNKNNQPIAERLTFVNNKEYIVPVTLTTDTLNLNSRQKNRWSLKFPEAFTGNISVAVTDADFDTTVYRHNNIVSNFLVSADLKGYIHNPAFYFTNEGEAVDNALDLVMMTNGWRRFRWEELPVITAKKQPYNDPGFIKVTGIVNLTNSKKVFADKDLLLKLTTADTAQTMQLLKTNSKGEFRIDSMFFFGRSRFLFTDVKGTRSNDITITLGPDSLKRNFNLVTEKLAVNNKWTINDRAKYYLNNHRSELGKMLTEVTVKAKRKTTVEELESRYVSGLFAGDAVKRINLLDETMYGYNTIFDYLQFRVPGVGIIWNDVTNEYQLFYRHNQNHSVSAAQGDSGGSGTSNQGMTIYLDEVETASDVLGRIHPSQIAYIKLFSNFVGAVGGGGNGILAVYTKKGEDALADMRMMGDEALYTGYTVIKDFYVPDYAVINKEDAKPDNRITLHWNAGIPVDKKNSTIPLVFYNNDNTKRFKIVVEGVSQNGKLIFLEKIIALNKKAF